MRSLIWVHTSRIVKMDSPKLLFLRYHCMFMSMFPVLLVDWVHRWRAASAWSVVLAPGRDDIHCSGCEELLKEHLKIILVRGENRWIWEDIPNTNGSWVETIFVGVYTLGGEGELWVVNTEHLSALNSICQSVAQLCARSFWGTWASLASCIHDGPKYDMFQYLAGYTSKWDRPVLWRYTPVSLLVYCCHDGFPPVIRHIPSVQGMLENSLQYWCNFICIVPQNTSGNKVWSQCLLRI